MVQWFLSIARTNIDEIHPIITNTMKEKLDINYRRINIRTSEQAKQPYNHQANHHKTVLFCLLWYMYVSEK